MKQIVVNTAFADQRVTGQQRYGHEIAEVLEVDAGAVRYRPRGRWASSVLAVWFWTQFVLPLRTWRAVLVSLTSRAPIWHPRHVLVVHDLFVLEHPEWYSRRYVWTHAPLLRAQLFGAKEVLAVSPAVAQQVARYRRRPVKVAPNAPSELFTESRPAGPDDSALERLEIRAGEYLLAVGSRDPRKNLGRLAAAYGSLEPSERQAMPLVIVGGSAAIYRSDDVPWPAGTVDAGYVSDDELRQLYRHARCVVFVPLAEGFGLPLVEAAAAGAPSLVISDIEVFRWICGEHARYVDPLSVPDIAAGLRATMEAPHRQALGPGRFTWGQSAEVVATACREVGGVRAG